MGLRLLWTVWTHRVCSTNCVWKQKPLSAPRGKMASSDLPQSELFMQLLVDLSSLGKFKYRLEIVCEQDKFVAVECS